MDTQTSLLNQRKIPTIHLKPLLYETVFENMFTALSICTKPINFKRKFNYFIKPNSIFSSRLEFSKKFICDNFVYSKQSMDKNHKINMYGHVRTRLISNEKLEIFEQESFNDDSMRFEPSGLEATLNNQSKWIIAIMFGAIILWRHDAEALWTSMGSILNAGLSTVLKKILNQERPFSTLRSDPGMPSSHSQSIFFIVTFIVLSMVEWYQLNGVTTILGVVILGFGGYLSWLRVSQKLHTVSQVVVGALLGSICSCLCYWSWNAIVLDAFESSFSVWIAVVLGAAVIFLAFFAYVTHYRVMDEQ